MKLSEFSNKLIYTERCALCGKVVRPNVMICEKCSKNLPRIDGKICEICGCEKRECFCRTYKMFYKRRVAPFYYDGNVREGINLFKFRSYPNAAKTFVYEMSETIKNYYDDIDFDMIVNVPMTRKSVMTRGYNQSELLAKGLSKSLNVPYCKGILKKIYKTQKQHEIPFTFRKGNLVGAFDIVDPDAVKDKTVLICDDVSTSGETFNECAKMLWLYGAKETYCVSIALTRKRKK